MLAVVSREREGTYGYKITQTSGRPSTYRSPPCNPVLRRLQKEECLEVYDLAIDGRNRRYYKITEKGRCAAEFVPGGMDGLLKEDYRNFGGGSRMNRETFLRELEYLLQDMGEEERADALAYYRDYLDEAGPENEEKVIREFGSPERVAAMIRAGEKGGMEDGGEFTETGYGDERFKDPGYEVRRPNGGAPMRRAGRSAGRMADPRGRGRGPGTTAPAAC